MGDQLTHPALPLPGLPCTAPVPEPPEPCVRRQLHGRLVAHYGAGCCVVEVERRPCDEACRHWREGARSWERCGRGISGVMAGGPCGAWEGGGW